MQEGHEKPVGRAARALRRWALPAIAAALLLALSQMLWMWQSWPVRHLLQLVGGDQ